MVRSILEEFEKMPTNHLREPLLVGILEKGIETEKGRANQVRAEHIRWMIDAGLLGGVPGASGYVLMTNQGCDYLDNIRQAGVWEETKRVAAESGGPLALEVAKQLAMALARKAIEDRTGLKL